MSAAGGGTKRPPLAGDREAAVCVVGAGYTGLWTAYYLKRAQPDLEVVVVESEFAGFGASGRNGGWLSSYFPAPRAKVLADHGRQAVLDLQQAMLDTVDEVIDVCVRESIDAEIRKSGVLAAARSEIQLQRLRSALAEDLASGFAEPGTRELGPDELSERVHLSRNACWLMRRRLMSIPVFS